MRNCTTAVGDTVEAMSEDDIYRYWGHMQYKTNSARTNETKARRKILKSHKKHIKHKVKLKKNKIKAINTYAISVLTFSFGIMKRTPTNTENLQTKRRTLLTRYRFHHPRAAKERLNLPR
jgi:hypothetical protein